MASMRFGVHVSIVGGLVKAAEMAKERRCETIQIFASNPRSWKTRELSRAEVKGFRRACQRLGLAPVIAHTPYVINLACREEILWRKSVKGLITALRHSQLTGCSYLVMHLGSHQGSGESGGMKKIGRAIDLAMKKVSGVELLLENSAGAGFSLGYSLEQLSVIISRLADSHRVGICLDTCHAFAAGYDLASKEGLSRMLLLFDKLLGLKRLKLIHANDSKAPLASRLDRHAELGKGFIGKEGLRIIVNHPKLKHLPAILETPGMKLEDDIRNLTFLRSLVKRAGN